MAFQQSDAIEIKRCKGKGRAVYARRAIRKGEIIERVPVIQIPEKEYAEGLSKTVLRNYCFGWSGDQVVIALGYGSIYNHSYRPNARYEDISSQAKDFIALRDIEAGEEITVNYNGKARSRIKVWFDVIEPEP